MNAGLMGTPPADCSGRSSPSRRPLRRAPVTGVAPSRTSGSRWLTSAKSARSCAAPPATTPSYASCRTQEATSSTCGALATCGSRVLLDTHSLISVRKTGTQARAGGDVSTYYRLFVGPCARTQFLVDADCLHGVGGLDEESRVLGGELQPFVVRLAPRRLGCVPDTLLPRSGRHVGQEAPLLFTDRAYFALLHSPPLFSALTRRGPHLQPPVKPT